MTTPCWCDRAHEVGEILAPLARLLCESSPSDMLSAGSCPRGRSHSLTLCRCSRRRCCVSCGAGSYGGVELCPGLQCYVSALAYWCCEGYVWWSSDQNKMGRGYTMSRLERIRQLGGVPRYGGVRAIACVRGQSTRSRASVGQRNLRLPAGHRMDIR